MRRLIYILIITSSFFLSFAQKESANWCFGVKAGITFNQTPPTALKNIAIGTSEGTSTISDRSGKLLFYTNAEMIWNANHDTMKNSLSLIGRKSIIRQPVLILPFPSHKYKYYVFTQKRTDYLGKETALYYSVVDMRKDHGLGAVTSKSETVTDFISGSMAAVKHVDDKSIWLLVHNNWNNAFWAYRITSSGITDSPVVSKCGSVSSRYLKISPDGSTIINVTDIPYKHINVLSFNKKTGKVQYRYMIGDKKNPMGYPEFSPNSSKLYAAGNKGIVQYNLGAGDSTKVKNSAYNLGKLQIGPAIYRSYAMQLGMDGDIYIATHYNFLGKISNPNGADTNCKLVTPGITLYGRSSFGLPTFLSSYFFVPPFRAAPTCFGDQTKFSLTDTSGVDSVLWHFGDPNAGLDSISKLWEPEHTFTDTGNFHVTAYLYRKGIPDTTLRDIRITPYPHNAFEVASDTSQCLNTNRFRFISHSYAEDGNATLYWDFEDGGFADGDTVAYSFHKPGRLKVLHTVASEYGCETKDSVYVRAYVPPSGFQVNNPGQCLKGNRFVFTADTAKQERPTTHFWDMAGLDSFNSPVAKYRFGTAGAYTVTHIATYSDGCKDTTSKLVRAFPMPEAKFSANDTDQCLKGNHFFFRNASAISSGNMAYHWQFHDSATSTAVEPGFSYQCPGAYDARLRCISDMGCTDSAHQNIYVRETPSGLFSVNDTGQCLGQNNFLFNNLSSVGQGELHYKWAFGDGDSAFVKCPVKKFKGFGKFHVSLEAVSGHGCSSSYGLQVEVFPAPVAMFYVNDTLQCQKNNFVIFSNASSVSPGSLTYNWDLGDGTHSTNRSISHHYAYGDTFTASLKVNSNHGCKDSFSRKIIIGSSPKAGFTINDPVQCQKEQEFLINDLSTVTNDSIISSTLFIDSQALALAGSLVLPGLQTRTTDLKLITVTSLGCKDSITKQITVHPSPTAAFSINDSTQCLDANNFLFTNQSSISSGSLSYLWTIDSRHQSGHHSSPDTSREINHQYSFTDWGKYTVKLKATSGQNCNDSLAKNVYVYPMPVTRFIFEHNCLMDTMYFYDQSYTDSGTVMQWYWQFGDSSSSWLKNPAHIYQDTGKYGVTLTSTSDFGCSTDSTRTFNIHPEVAANEIRRATVEENGHVLVEWEKAPRGRPMTYHLERSGDGQEWHRVSNSASDVLYFRDFNTWPQEKPYSYRMNITDSCEHTSGYSNNARSIHLSVNNDGALPALTWNKYEVWEQGVNNYTIQVKGKEENDYQNIATLSPATTTYTDSVTSLNKSYYCYRVQAIRNGDSVISNSNSVCIPTEFHCYIPNSFTPNGDGLNDRFRVSGTFILEYKMMVFNRWGEKLYESTDYNEGWDGTFRGRTCPVGMYHYGISVEGTMGKREIFSGTVFLVR